MRLGLGMVQVHDKIKRVSYKKRGIAMHSLAQIHGLVWGLMVILFLLSYLFYQQKVWSMILRLTYLVMIGTGIAMLFIIHFPFMLVVKAILSFALIGLMEAALGKRKKQQPAGLLLVLSAVFLIVILLIGYRVI
ncbi:uncharacterized protein UPF0344 [Sporolactobacillus inulinus]|uniref:Uncharacterized protein UPF0344 n=2 Tax=Sporolactobacillus inulinus TaxID=2078 RepID=A0A4Y1Z7D1_9BACL|nr:uncharacterized protein UPF0344 [Sporolactobacillus inulinus]